jgi:phosphoglycolate phosphatase
MGLAIFDFDGTLCATHEAITFCMRRTFADFGEPVPEAAAVYQTISAGIGLAESIRLLRRSGRESSVEETARWVAHYRTIYNSGEGEARTHLFHGVAELFAGLSAQRIPMAIVSNKGLVAVRAAVDRFGLSHYVPLLVCDAPDVPRKPDPRLFTMRIKHEFPLIQPGNVWVVGDTKVDIEFARNIGARACWVSWGYGIADECRALAPDAIAVQPRDVARLFGSDADGAVGVAVTVI